MGSPPATSYDEIPYTHGPSYYTHPNRLATLAILHGMTPAPVTRCRVLELGCGCGGNLIPMAASLPGCSFVGVDLSTRQTAYAQELIRALGLTNIDVQPRNILDLDRSLGHFDYIICHGVYSYVPADVQDRILQILDSSLAANGVAYVSYNTYPGWHLRGVVREMLNFHVTRFQEAQVRVQQARGFLDFLAESVGDPKSVYGQLIQQEAEILRSKPDTYLFHEQLEDVNCPLYFHQFMARAEANGLQYLDEARPSSLPGDLPPKVRYVLDAFASERVAREQYLDFLSNGTFRRTLLCRQEVALRAEPALETLAQFRVTTSLHPVSLQPDIRSMAPEEFSSLEEGLRVSTNQPLAKAALVALFEAWPRSVPFESLCSMIQERLSPDQVEHVAGVPFRPQLSSVLLRCFRSCLVDLQIHEAPFVLQVSQRPVASCVARILAERQDHVPNLRHASVQLSNVDRFVLCRLDGSRDQPALLGELGKAVADGVLEMQQEGIPLDDVETLQHRLQTALDRSLDRLAHTALLVG